MRLTKTVNSEMRIGFKGENTHEEKQEIKA